MRIYIRVNINHKIFDWINFLYNLIPFLLIEICSSVSFSFTCLQYGGLCWIKVEFLSWLNSSIQKKRKKSWIIMAESKNFYADQCMVSSAWKWHHWKYEQFLCKSIFMTNFPLFCHTHPHKHTHEHKHNFFCQ